MKSRNCYRRIATLVYFLLFLLCTAPCLRARENVTITLDDGVKFEMIWVEGGSFLMGAPASSDEYAAKPAHHVTVSGYYIGKYEVTNEQWRAVMGYSLRSDRGSNYPAAGISWYEAMVFIKKLNKKTGRNFRMPTEAEWEFAAKGGVKSKKYRYSGSNDINEVAWNGNYRHPEDDLHPVGMKKPNELGIYDMSGNASEWCYDWKGNYSAARQTNPKGPRLSSSRVQKVIKGGECRTLRCEPYVRDAQSAMFSVWNNSFRLVLSGENNAYNKDILYGEPVEMVYCPKATFNMGDTKVEYDYAKLSLEDWTSASNLSRPWYPVHKVTLNAFYLNRYETTQGLWEAVMGYNNSSTKGALLPVDNVSWTAQ